MHKFDLLHKYFPVQLLKCRSIYVFDGKVGVVAALHTVSFIERLLCMQANYIISSSYIYVFLEFFKHPVTKINQNNEYKYGQMKPSFGLFMK